MENQQKKYGSPAESARLKELIKALKMTQNKFGKSIGLSGQHISYITRGERGITEDFANRIARYHSNVVANWLLTGEGEMLKPPAVDSEGALVEELRKENLRLLNELRHTLELLDIRTKSDELHANMLRDVLGNQKG